MEVEEREVIEKSFDYPEIILHKMYFLSSNQGLFLQFSTWLSVFFTEDF